MPKIDFTREAVQDLASIWMHSCEYWSKTRANRYYRSLQDGLKRVALDPLMGRTFEEIKPGLRGLTIQRHIAFYLILGDRSILVVRILHQRMDLQRKLTD